ncbi:hypothetical protein D3C76_1743610 [compost metagenome]
MAIKNTAAAPMLISGTSWNAACRPIRSETRPVISGPVARPNRLLARVKVAKAVPCTE